MVFLVAPPLSKTQNTFKKDSKRFQFRRGVAEFNKLRGLYNFPKIWLIERERDFEVISRFQGNFDLRACRLTKVVSEAFVNTGDFRV